MDEQAASAELQKFLEKGAPTKCTCHWPNPLFDATLAEYIGMRMEVHRIKKNHQHFPYALGSAITMLRHRLEVLAPCRECIIKYNPTGRLRPQVWNPARERAYRECFN